MALKIVRATDAIKVTTLKALFYGQPGLGKTSFGFTCDRPLNLDFDKGAYRSKQRKDTLEINAWRDIEELMQNPRVFTDYRTIVVDTVGRCLDVITQHILEQNPKFKGFGGALSLQGYGALKGIFGGWVKQLTLQGLDVIFLAHDREDKEGDRVFKRPDVQGGSYAEVMKTADLIGYMSMRNNRATLDFTPCDDFIAKNGAGFNTAIVPDFLGQPNFGAELLETAKMLMSSAATSDAELQVVIDEWRELIATAETPEDFTKLLGDVGKIEEKSVLAQVKKLLDNARKELGFEYDAKAKQFYSKEVAA